MPQVTPLGRPAGTPQVKPFGRLARTSQETPLGRAAGTSQETLLGRRQECSRRRRPEDTHGGVGPDGVAPLERPAVATQVVLPQAVSLRRVAAMTQVKLLMRMEGEKQPDRTTQWACRENHTTQRACRENHTTQWTCGENRTTQRACRENHTTQWASSNRQVQNSRRWPRDWRPRSRANWPQD